MTLSHIFSRSLAKFYVWRCEHPLAARAVVLALPVVLALAVALLAHNPALATPVSGGGGGTGG